MTRLERFRKANGRFRKTNGYPEWLVKAIVKAGGAVDRHADKRQARQAIIRSVTRCETFKQMADMLVKQHAIRRKDK